MGIRLKASPVRQIVALLRAFALGISMLLLWQSMQIPLSAKMEPTHLRTLLASLLMVQTPPGTAEISGPWKDQSGYAINLYQSGMTIQGDHSYGTKYTISGTVNGNTFAGTMTQQTAPYTASLVSG